MTDPGPQPRLTLPGQRRPAEGLPEGTQGEVTASFVGGDVVPLSHRVTTLSIVRTLLCAVLLADAAVAGRLDSAGAVLLPIGYLVAAGLASAVVPLVSHRASALAGLGVVLCADSAALQFARYELAGSAAAELAIGIFLAAACLLASFRTGLKLVIWQSLLIGVMDQGIRSGMFGPPAGYEPDRLVTELVALWALVLVVCVAASVSERELRRRRLDAESMQTFAAALHRDDAPALVLRRVIRFMVEDLDAGRVLVCARHEGRLALIAAHGLDGIAAAHPDLESAAGAPSGLLDLTARPGTPALLLGLDARRDPWLSALLPGASRLIVLPLGPDQRSAPLWLVLEHRGRGFRVERRVLATAGQVSATAALALSRAGLFQQILAWATTDALTRLPNRRTFDERLAELAASRPALRFAVVLADVDRFKAVNDTHGHQVGDQVLQAVAAALAGAMPPGAMAARYGGEEFVVLLPGADAGFAMRAAETLRAAVTAIEAPLPVTASFGVTASSGEADPHSLLAAADAALYEAKDAGRNAVRLGAPAPARR